MSINWGEVLSGLILFFMTTGFVGMLRMARQLRSKIDHSQSAMQGSILELRKENKQEFDLFRADHRRDLSGIEMKIGEVQTEMAKLNGRMIKQETRQTMHEEQDRDFHNRTQLGMERFVDRLENLQKADRERHERDRRGGGS